MSRTTRATLALAKLGVKFTLHAYDYDPNADRIGLQAAEALGIEPRRMLKTLVAEVDGKPVCAVVPSDREVSMKKLAAAFAGKAASMMRPAGGDRPGGLGRDQRIFEWRTARATDRARSQRRRQGARCDRAGADGVSGTGRAPARTAARSSASWLSSA